MLAKRKIPVDLDPGELQSIKSYQIEKDQEQKASEETSEPPKKKAKVLIKEEDEEKEKEKSEEKTEEKGETIEGTYTTLATLDYPSVPNRRACTFIDFEEKILLQGLILACTFIDFEKKFPPARLF